MQFYYGRLLLVCHQDFHSTSCLAQHNKLDTLSSLASIPSSASSASSSSTDSVLGFKVGFATATVCNKMLAHVTIQAVVCLVRGLRQIANTAHMAHVAISWLMPPTHSPLALLHHLPKPQQAVRDYSPVSPRSQMRAPEYLTLPCSLIAKSAGERSGDPSACKPVCCGLEQSTEHGCCTGALVPRPAVAECLMVLAQTMPAH